MNLKYPIWCALALSGLLCLSGCATGDVAMMPTISGGEKVRVPLSRQGVVWTNEGGLRIEACTFAPTKDKKLTYVFAFADTQKRALRSVKVEDVADEKPALLVDNADPKLSASGQWRGETEPIDPKTDPRMAWLVTLPNSMRVYRFTLTFADGKSLVLMQGILYPEPMKAAIRELLGMK